MKRILPFLTIMALPFSGLFAKPLEVGAPAPRADVTLHSGATASLGTLYDAGTVLVYFYPKADTSGCTAQACSLRDAYSDLEKHGVHVLGVSGDKPEKLVAFRDKHELPFDLVSDPDGALMQAFGVPHTMGIAARQAFLVREGNIVWRDLKASTHKQAEDVLAALSAE